MFSNGHYLKNVSEHLVFPYDMSSGFAYGLTKHRDRFLLVLWCRYKAAWCASSCGFCVVRETRLHEVCLSLF